ncbi:YbgC/FadM family acyl-CoA thioesterase [Novosphingobium album (ex Liu et al. 2023)]|uniref:YbgC/FadM family acyl-CoA thioesterase n=1 Tax=Novosphingobium album (ex Liu et al. 2023) TaxID=3031130 RepID=A0ABT5WJL0_9SPHN|nr:YbgC/FadM family acyl-CoA thioesterase [Novosphingobium album (ex Liu et al. 2023)]MDE8650229.1 YbgC/FadM family acyl-CoA thioesterase [Novosphingobium album (ex Liu et al. 2023)]
MTSFPEPPAGILEGQVHRYALRVFYEDTDAGGVVYHANYLRWFERARSDILELLGIDQRAALDTGVGGYTVSEVTIRYLAPARLGDAVMIETRAEAIGRASCVMLQSAWRKDTRLCEARLRLGFIGPDGRPRRQPDAWRQAFAALVPPSGDVSPSGR